MKKLFAVLICVALVITVFAGCSNSKDEKYGDKVLIIGYTEATAPILEIGKDGKATGFEAELLKAIFDGIRGEFKDYVFEEVEEGYELEKDGGFLDSNDKEYSAGLLMGVVTTNRGTFNEDYSFTEPIVTNRVIAMSVKGNSRYGYTDFLNAHVITVSDAAAEALEKNTAIASVCEKIEAESDINKALKKLDNGEADILVTDEFSFMPTGKEKNYQIFPGELDRIDYVIACAKYSGWKDTINEAIYELKSEDYGEGDEFTPIVEKAFGYNASSFNWEPDESK